MNRMKTLTALVLAAALCLAGCTAGALSSSAVPSAPASSAAPSSASGEPVTLTVFAAASLTETLTRIAEDYTAAHPQVTFSFNFDSSGTLQTQIEEGADCDLFLSAAQKQMDALESQGLMDAATRRDLLENKVVLAVPEGNPAGITEFADIGTDRCTLVALGNDDVPVGSYSREILQNLGIWDGLEQAGKITYGSNVKEVTTQVAEAAADCGIVYATDAFSAGLEVVAQAQPDWCSPVVYPGAVTASSAHADEALAFLDSLGEAQAAQVFRSVGFTVVGEGA